MNLFVATYGALLLLAVAGFCSFRLLATLEPTTNTTQFLVFRIGDAVFGLSILRGIACLISKALRKSPELSLGVE